MLMKLTTGSKDEQKNRYFIQSHGLTIHSVTHASYCLRLFLACKIGDFEKNGDVYLQKFRICKQN
jgi:hypothetical protein